MTLVPMALEVRHFEVFNVLKIYEIYVVISLQQI
jgi:hypothetical protein